MGKFIVKLTDEQEGRDYYLEWSTVSDSPASPGMSLEEFTEYYRDKYGSDGMREFKARMARVEKTGTSSHFDTLDILIRNNDCYEDGTPATREEIIAGLREGWPG